uniref:Uncharacterized protein n=1 Tax=Chelonoidis abingdonii TaxID=106734 RepID=A0A8C0IS05_CHEAB
MTASHSITTPGSHLSWRTPPHRHREVFFPILKSSSPRLGSFAQVSTPFLLPMGLTTTTKDSIANWLAGCPQKGAYAPPPMMDIPQPPWAIYSSVSFGPILEFVEVILDPIPTLQHVYLSPQLSVIRELAEGAIHPIIQIINEDIEQNRPQDRPSGHSA